MNIRNYVSTKEVSSILGNIGALFDNLSIRVDMSKLDTVLRYNLLTLAGTTGANNTDFYIGYRVEYDKRDDGKVNAFVSLSKLISINKNITITKINTVSPSREEVYKIKDKNYNTFYIDHVHKLTKEYLGVYQKVEEIELLQLMRLKDRIQLYSGMTGLPPELANIEDGTLYVSFDEGGDFYKAGYISEMQIRRGYTNDMLKCIERYVDTYADYQHVTKYSCSLSSVNIDYVHLDLEYYVEDSSFSQDGVDLDAYCTVDITRMTSLEDKVISLSKSIVAGYTPQREKTRFILKEDGVFKLSELELFLVFLKFKGPEIFSEEFAGLITYCKPVSPNNITTSITIVRETLSCSTSGKFDFAYFLDKEVGKDPLDSSIIFIASKENLIYSINGDTGVYEYGWESGTYSDVRMHGIRSGVYQDKGVINGLEELHAGNYIIESDFYNFMCKYVIKILARSGENGKKVKYVDYLFALLSGMNESDGYRSIYIPYDGESYISSGDMSVKVFNDSDLIERRIFYNGVCLHISTIDKYEYYIDSRKAISALIDSTGKLQLKEYPSWYSDDI